MVTYIKVSGATQAAENKPQKKIKQTNKKNVYYIFYEIFLKLICYTDF